MSSSSRIRIASLLPSLTEVVCKLGFEEQLVCRSHECDFPKPITHLPVVTEPKYSVSKNDQSGDIHQSITELLQQGLSVYRVDDEKLADLKPDIIFTQDHCEVCAVSFHDLELAIQKYLDKGVEIVSVSPATLDEIFDSFITVAKALNCHEKGDDLVRSIRNRFKIIREKTSNQPKPEVVSIEWMDPLMTGGNWMPELIEIAGGINRLSTAGEHSPWIEWDKIVETNPDIILLLPCGYSINKTLKEVDNLTEAEPWKSLKAVQNNQVYILDGNQYFNRSGPRIEESVEILAQIFHPQLFEPTLKQSGWIHFDQTPIILD
ncbi:MAG: cobalamin-binding protein [Balneolaceae bacterium]